MKRATSITIACVLAVLAGLATQIRAQQIDTQDRTILTFSSAVELPGVRLDPGTYEFRLADTPSRNVVQVFRKMEQDASVATGAPVGQFTFAQAQRQRTSDETVVMFREAREGETPAVQYWYFPGEKIGKEFIYPKDQAARIASQTGQAVLSDDGRIDAGGARADASQSPASESAASTPSTSPSSTSPSASAGASTASSSTGAAASGSATTSPSSDDTLRNAPAPAQPTAAAGSTAGNRGVTEDRPTASASASASVETPARQQPESTTARAGAPAAQTRVDAELEPAARPVGTTGADQAAGTRQGDAADGQIARAGELPRTASPLPLAGLIGLLSLAGAAGLRYVRS